MKYIINIGIIIVSLFYNPAFAQENTEEQSDTIQNYVSKTYFIVNAENANIRSKATAKSDIVGSVSNGDSLVTFEEKSKWIKIKHNGITGYVSKSILTKKTDFICKRHKVIQNISSIKNSYFSLKSTSLYIAIVIGLIVIMLFRKFYPRLDPHFLFLKGTLSNKRAKTSLPVVVILLFGLMVYSADAWYSDFEIFFSQGNLPLNPMNTNALLLIPYGCTALILISFIVGLAQSIIKVGPEQGLLRFNMQLTASLSGVLLLLLVPRNIAFVVFALILFIFWRVGRN